MPTARPTVTADTIDQFDNQDLAVAPAVQHELTRLERANERLVQIMDSLPGLVGYVDLDLRIVYANRLIEQWYCRPRAELIGMKLETLFSKDHYRIVETLLRRVLSGEEINEEREIRYPDGATRTVHLNYIPDRGQSGVNGYYFLVRDVSERCQAENALKQANELLDRRVRAATQELQQRNEELLLEIVARRNSEERYRIVSELMSDLIYVNEIDAAGAIRTIWMTGKLIEQIAPSLDAEGRHGLWRRIVHPDDEAILDQRFARLLANQSSVDEFRVIDKYGDTRWLRAYGRPIWSTTESRVVQIMVAAQDITETRRAVQLLQDNRQMLEAALESMSEGFMLFDEQGRLVVFNEKIRQLFPKTAPYFEIGVSFESLLRHSARSGEVRNALDDPDAWVAERLESFPSASGSVEVELTDGRWILSTDRPTGYGVVAIRTDITERKQTEELRRRQEAELAHVLRRASMGEMASALAHELSQPLAVVVNYANGLLRRLDESPVAADSAREVLQHIGNAGQRAKDIINHVSDFVRLGKPEVAVERLQDLVDDVHQMLRSRLNRNGIRMLKMLGERDIEIEVNKIEIRQVLFNLVSNSIDALQQSAHEDKQILLKLDPDEPRFVTLSVIDNGPGIDPAVRDKLFEPYVTTKQMGLGMGLSICRTLIEGHGGRLWFDPEFDAGACLCLRLPLARNRHG